MSEQAAASAVTAQAAVQSGVLVKLFALTFALAFAPITCYYVSRDYFWNGDSTFAAITAVVAANIVLVTYIFMSVQEERKLQDTSKSEKEPNRSSETKKNQ